MKILSSVIRRSRGTKYNKEKKKSNSIFGKIEGDVALMKQRAFELHKVNNNNRIGTESQEKLLVSKTKRKINEK